MGSRFGDFGLVLAVALVLACGGKTGRNSAPAPVDDDAGTPVDSGTGGTPDLGTGGTSGSASEEPFVNAFGCGELELDEQALADAQATACVATAIECELLSTDLLLLLDRSAAMGESWGASSRFSIALDGIAGYLTGQAFLHGAGLQVFSARGLGDEFDCTDDTYVTPLVEIDAVDMVGAAIESAAVVRPPQGPATLGPALRGALRHAEAHALAHPERSTIVVLLSSGTSDSCGSSLEELAQSIETSSARVAVIGMGAGTDIDVLAAADQRRAFAIVEGDGPERVTEALDGIVWGRGARACNFQLPYPPPGQVLNAPLARVFLGSHEVPKLAGEADCATSADGGWYFVTSEPEDGIGFCPCTCASMSCEAQLRVLVPCTP